MANEQIPKTAPAVVFEKINGPIVYKEDHPVTQPQDLKPGEVLVKIECTGVCHTDLHAWKGDWPMPPKQPLVGGHEGAGHIVAIADGTTTTFKVGDAVGIKWLADSCLNCENCRMGAEMTCSLAQCHGYTVDGSFQRYAVSYARHCTPIPDGLPLEVAAPVLCAGVTVWKAIKEANCKPGDWLVVSGAGGGLGHLAVQYATAIGLRVVGIDTGDDKKKLLDQYGADAFIDFKNFRDEGALIKEVKRVCGGEGPHAAVIASAGGAAYNDALEYIRPHGSLVAVGLPPDTDIKANVFWTVFRNVRIIGSYVGNRQDAIEALDFALRGKVKPQIVTEPLKNLEDVYKRMESGGIPGRIVLKC
ncbi:putative Alcohol dehydrogenase [Rhodotorula taiwanensis]|uniref:alcohol dehydrogenase n=1 Tax=Rhodotorula taiwanensis TaxID=741276 RepID=A0A2S5BIT1_9BASI|nr:putative Alcohol dehydrogenase [Rhodotorula taiwanensis]